jgi:hypothetical protein
MKLAVPTDLQTLNFNAEISLYQVL